MISAGAAVFSLPASHSQIERAELRSADPGLGPSTRCSQPQRTELVGPIWGGVYQAFELTATASLESGEVVLRAGETVRIGSGFRVASGVRFASRSAEPMRTTARVAFQSRCQCPFRFDWQSEFVA